MYKIPKSWGILREPRTPKDKRKDVITLGFPHDVMFDWDTLFNDVIDIGNNQVLLIGPPLYELKPLIKFVHDGAVLNTRFIDEINVGLTVVQTNSKTFTLEHPSESIEITVNERSTSFSGMGCMSTMQKNEPIHWICDWVQYHHKVHGVGGFAIYDNNSDKYTVEELQSALDALPLDVVVHVIPWNVPFGPHTPKWDSNFSQFTQLEHWKFKYAWCSNFAINQDIDELLVTDGFTIDDVLADIHNNKYPGVIYRTRNIDPYNDKLDCAAHDLEVSERRFADYYYYSEYNNTNNTKVGRRLIDKWISVPKYSMKYQWAVHDFGYGFNNNSVKVTPDSGLYFCHMYAMQSKHKDKHPSFHDRNKHLVPKDNLEIDLALKQSLEKAFS